jgi:hypothetical protein
VKNLTAKFSIGFVVLCQWLLSGFLLVAIVPLFVEAIKNQNETKWFDAVMLSPILLVCAIAGYGLIRRTKWGWFLSLLLGLAAASLGISCIWSASRDTQYARMEGGFLFGSGVLILSTSVVGLMALFLPPTRRFIFRRLENEAGV